MTNAYDPETVRFFDIAHEGAQIRAIAQALPTLVAKTQELNPRSIVVLATDQVTRTCAEFIVSAFPGLCRVPVVIAASAPAYVGALDVVVLVGERTQCDWASQALLSAARRGATCIYAGPSSGPLFEDVSDSAFVIPALPGVEGLSPARALVTLYALLASVGGTHQSEELSAALEQWAQAVDSELESLSPARDSDINPGRQLAEFISNSWSVHSCETNPYEPETAVPVGQAIGSVAATLWATHGLPATALDAAQLPVALEQHAQHAQEEESGKSQIDDIFHDPFIDGEPSGADLVALRVILWDQSVTDLPRAMAVSCADEQSSPPGKATSEQAIMQRCLQLITRAYAVTAYLTQ